MEVRSNAAAVTPPPSWRGQPQHLPPASADDLPSQLPPPLSLLSEPEGPTSLRSRSDSPTTSTHNASTQTATRRVAVSSRGALTAAADRVTLPPPDAPQQGVVDARVYLTARPWSPRHNAGKCEPQRARMRAQPVAECDDEQASAPDMRQPELKAVALARSPVPVVSMQQHQSGQGTSVSLSDQTPPRAAATRVAAAPPVVPPNAALPPRSASSSSQERDATARGSRGDIGRMPPPRIPSLGLRRTLEPPSSDGAAAQARAPGDATAGAASPGRVSPEASPGRTSATFPPSSPIAQLAPLLSRARWSGHSQRTPPRPPSRDDATLGTSSSVATGALARVASGSSVATGALGRIQSCSVADGSGECTPASSGWRTARRGNGGVSVATGSAVTLAHGMRAGGVPTLGTLMGSTGAEESESMGASVVLPCPPLRLAGLQVPPGHVVCKIYVH